MLLSTALPFTKHPESSRTFQMFFSKGWRDTLHLSIFNFISSVYIITSRGAIESTHRAQQVSDAARLTRSASVRSTGTLVAGSGPSSNSARRRLPEAPKDDFSSIAASGQRKSAQPPPRRSTITVLKNKVKNAVSGATAKSKRATTGEQAVSRGASTSQLTSSGGATGS